MIADRFAADCAVTTVIDELRVGNCEEVDCSGFILKIPVGWTKEGWGWEGRWGFIWLWVDPSGVCWTTTAGRDKTVCDAEFGVIRGSQVGWRNSFPFSFPPVSIPPFTADSMSLNSSSSAASNFDCFTSNLHLHSFFLIRTCYFFLRLDVLIFNAIWYSICSWDVFITWIASLYKNFFYLVT